MQANTIRLLHTLKKIYIYWPKSIHDVTVSEKNEKIAKQPFNFLFIRWVCL